MTTDRVLRIAWICSIGVVLAVRYPSLGRVRVTPADLIVVMFFGTMLWRRATNAWRDVVHSSVFFWLLAFSIIVSIVGAAVAWSRLGYLPQWTLINRGVGTVFLLASVFLVGSAPVAQQAEQELWKWLILSGSAVNVVALVGMTTGLYWHLPNRFVEGADSMRLAGTMANPNAFGGYLALVLVAQLAVLTAPRKTFQLPRWVFVVNGMLLTVGLLLTISRGAWLAALAGGAAVLTISAVSARAGRAHWRNVAGAAAVVAIIGIVAAMSLSSLFAAPRATGNPNPLQSRRSIYRFQGGSPAGEFLRIARDPYGGTDRLVIARVALAKLASPADFAFGIGTGVFLEESPQSPLRWRVLIHNDYLWMLVELGLVGVVIFLGLLVSLFLPVVRSVLMSRVVEVPPLALFGALITLSVYFLSQDGMYRRYTWLVIGLGILFARSRRP